MTDSSEEAAYIEKLYEYGEQLNNATDKCQVTSLFQLQKEKKLFYLFGFF